MGEYTSLEVHGYCSYCSAFGLTPTNRGLWVCFNTKTSTTTYGSKTGTGTVDLDGSSCVDVSLRIHKSGNASGMLAATPSSDTRIYLFQARLSSTSEIEIYFNGTTTTDVCLTVQAFK